MMVEACGSKDSDVGDTMEEIPSCWVVLGARRRIARFKCSVLTGKNQWSDTKDKEPLRKYESTINSM